MERRVRKINSETIVITQERISSDQGQDRESISKARMNVKDISVVKYIR